MRNKAFRHDMSTTLAIHDALRRDLERIARLAARGEDEAWRVLRFAGGWEMFERYLRVHHDAEDAALWPLLRRRLARRPDELALIAVMEAEHATFDPLLDTIDAALADPVWGPARLDDLLDGLVTGLRGHLAHEEDEVLPLLDAVAGAEQVHRLDVEHGRRIGSGTCHYLPWLLDRADPETVTTILGRLPESILPTYLNRWQPAYAARDLWGTHNRSTPAS